MYKVIPSSAKRIDDRLLYRFARSGNTVTQGLLVFVPSRIAVIHHILVLVNVKQFKPRPCRSKIDAVHRNKLGSDEVFDTAN